MWYFVWYSYSSTEKRCVSFVARYVNNGLIKRNSVKSLHVPPFYFKLIIGGKHFDYRGFNGQFANIFYDIDAPAFIDTDE